MYKTPNFARSLFALTWQAENDVRTADGIAAVGEAWVSETELLYRGRQMLPCTPVRIAWLSPSEDGHSHGAPGNAFSGILR